MIIKQLIKNINESIAPIYIKGKEKNIFLFSTPRSGSTWLLELLVREKGMSYCFEPFDIRSPVVKKKLSKLGVYSWNDIYAQNSETVLHNYKVLQNSYIKGRNPMPLELKRWKTGLLSKEYRFLSNRIVFKILHAFEDKIDWIKDNFDGQILYLIRHPIPVSLSRTVAPRINTFLDSDYSNHFSSDILKESKKILKKGDLLERKVLSWCFQNAVPLKNLKKSWTLLTFEELKTEPEKVINHLSYRLNLKSKDAIKKNINITSKTMGINKKDFDYLNTDVSKNGIDKWRNQISVDKEKILMDIVNLFGIDIYSFGENMADKKYLIK